MKNLQQNIEELDKMLNSYAKANFTLVPRVCPSCRKLILDTVSLEFLYEVGECPVCDHNYGEAMADRGDDSARYETERGEDL